jgi:hypothetical protein
VGELQLRTLRTVLPVLACHDLGISVVTLGSHVTSEVGAELRRDALRLIRHAVTVRDAAARRAA